MHTKPISTRRRRLRYAAPITALALVAAACGSDDAADAPAETTAEAPAEEPAEEAVEEPAEEAVEEPAEEATGAAGFASDDEILALCPADIAPDSIVFTTFPGQQEAIDPVTEIFTELTGVDVEWLENGLGDRLTKLAAESGSPTIDVALVPIAETPALLANGITEETNTSLPNYEQLLDVAKYEGGYGVSALQFGIAYNPEFIETPTTWLDLLAPETAGVTALPSMPNSGGYAFLSMLARIGGGDEADLTAAIDEVAAVKDDVQSFIGSSPTVEEQINSGEIQQYIDIGGVAVRASRERGVPVEFVVPEEGAPVSINSLVIPAGSDHLGCAEAFVAFMLGEDSQAAWATEFLYGSTSSVLEIDPELAPLLYPAPGSDSIVNIDWAVIAGNTADTLDYWNREVTG
jgi:putative spermidine/putrescine transport system substrate-binding protein